MSYDAELRREVALLREALLRYGQGLPPPHNLWISGGEVVETPPSRTGGVSA